MHPKLIHFSNHFDHCFIQNWINNWIKTTRNDVVFFCKISVLSFCVGNEGNKFGEKYLGIFYAIKLPEPKGGTRIAMSDKMGCKSQPLCVCVTPSIREKSQSQMDPNSYECLITPLVESLCVTPSIREKSQSQMHKAFQDQIGPSICPLRGGGFLCFIIAIDTTTISTNMSSSPIIMCE
jgi:hypothetical protein